MIVAVADTHTVLWHLYGDPKLSAVANEFISQAVQARQQIVISSISFVEIVYLVETGRISPTAYEDIMQALTDPEQVFVEAALSASIVASLRQVSRSEVADMPDRIVAATGLYFGVPVISRDRRIRAGSVKTIW